MLLLGLWMATWGLLAASQTSLSTLGTGPSMPSTFIPCGPCMCNGSVVDCSSRGLTSVPSCGLPATATSLSLRNNSISYLGHGIFTRFLSLRWLDLSFNLLRNISVDLFQSLPLTTLNLAHNHLVFGNGTNCIETPFANLVSLTHLDLSYNNLHNVSCAVVESNVSNLHWLDLSHNLYSLSTEPRLLKYLGKLAILDLSHNYLNSLSEHLFQDVRALQSLNLSQNQIPLNNNAYPLGVFAMLSNTLTELRLEGNCDASYSRENFSYPDKTFYQLTSLKYLQLDGLPNLEFGSGFEGMTSLTNLSLSGKDGGFCFINSLTNKTFLHVPQSLRSLHLSNCNITRIEMDAFRPLQHLHTLDLSFNLDLGFETLGNAFYSLQGSDLQELHINSIIHPYAMCVMVTPRNTRFFKHTHLETIHARGNRLEVFCEGALRNMPDSLKFVSVDENELGFGSYFKDLGHLKNLREIHNDGHKNAFEPPTEYPPDQMQQCSTGNVEELTDSGMNCHSPWHPEDFSLKTWEPQQTSSRKRRSSALHTSGKLLYTLPPNLETYVSRWDKLYYQILEVEFNTSNYLTVLNLCNNLLTTWIGPVTGLTKLVTLDLSNNFAHNVSTRFFHTLTSLKVLNVSRNFLRLIIENDTSGELFEPLHTLQSLYVSKNYLNAVPPNVFRGLINLQNLVLSHNSIFHFDVNISHMKNLSLLDLSYNYIRFLPQSVMDHLDSVAEYQQVTVDITFNSIACTCQHVDFLTWILTSKVKFRSSNRLSCLMSDGGVRERINVFDVIQSLQKSCTDKSGILVGAVSCAFCLLVAMFSALVYRYRWKLRYLYYASRLAYRRLQTCDDDNDDFEFDAFVSYSSEDNDFVHGELLEELETRAGLRLNVHNRDFIPGRPIPSNIVSAVQSSRRTLVVLSRELVQSEWCHYEMQMATMEAAHTGRDVLLFLLYEDVPSQQLPRDVLYNLQSSTYITFPGTRAEPSLVRDFWARLAQAIRQG
ncbi:toll-like receptor 4 [Littorina saxatilis]|uniref:TIR domain-containing protein n=1 Tax=Littorina saxatilis TaxID=31220 RepID=A0AAN9BW93_9CAEN